MSRIVQSGWEVGDVTVIGATEIYTTGTTPTVVAATPTPRSGGYCAKCLHDAGGQTFRGAGLRVTHASKTEVYYAVGHFAHSNGYTGAAPGPLVFVCYDTVANLNVQVAFDAGVYRAYVVTAGGSGNPSATTLLGTASAGVSYDAWHNLEIRIVASTTTGGTFALKVDGTTLISVSGVRTCQTNANLGAFSLCAKGSNGNTTANLYQAFDDLRVNDTAGARNTGWPGDESIRLLVPTAAGDSTQLARGGTDSGANWSQCDELPPTGATDYVSSDTVGQTDLYNLSTVAVASVSAIQVIVQGFNAGGGGTINLSIKTPAGQSDGAAQAITATPTLYTRLLEADPSDSAAFTAAKIDALQAGIRVAS